MALTSDLISEFVKVNRDEVEVKQASIVYGTIVVNENKKYVKLDGSDLLTPVSATTEAENGERVTVMIKNHEATVTGNISSPSARGESVLEIGNRITEAEILIADKVSTKVFDAQVGRIDDLTADNVLIKEQLVASSAVIDELKAKDVEITGTLEAQAASIENLDTHKLSATDADLKYATIGALEATDATVRNIQGDYAKFEETTTGHLSAIDADIQKLETNKLSAEQADVRYANIDFSNIDKAAMEYFYANSGLIEDVVVGEGTITGHLVGVTIKGDLIEAGTLVADKLVIKGEDGVYYKLNAEAGVTESEEVTEEQLQNGLHGSVILAQSITADRINVTDLVAFDATIGGFNITDNSLYSGVKESADNTTRGVYLDSEGQFVVGDSNSYLKYYKDSEGKYRLEISASSVSINTSGKTVEKLMEDAQAAVDKVTELEERVESGEFSGEDATTLRIESSRGTVFKNNNVSTVLSVVIYYGSKRITDVETLKATYGSAAYLEWSWQRLDEDRFGVLSSSDSRIGNGGFTLTIGAGDVDTKVVFMCSLNV